MKKIDDYKFISTAKGDQGRSKNYSNEEFSKSDLLFTTLGELDELNSFLGLLWHYDHKNPEIRKMQETLQHISSLVATTNEVVRTTKLVQVTTEDVLKLEELEQNLLLQNPLEPSFVLPGSDTSKVGAYYDLCRSITRRVERTLVKFIEENHRGDLFGSLQYLNRLSDLLFLYARKYAK